MQLCILLEPWGAPEDRSETTEGCSPPVDGKGCPTPSTSRQLLDAMDECLHRKVESSPTLSMEGGQSLERPPKDGSLQFEHAAALAAAEAAADALMLSDRGLGTDPAQAEAAADALLRGSPRATPQRLGCSPQRRPGAVLSELRHQAAAEALLDDLRTEVLKGERLEKVSSLPA